MPREIIVKWSECNSLFMWKNNQFAWKTFELFGWWVMRKNGTWRWAWWVCWEEATTTTSFFFDLRTIFDRKKGNDVMNQILTISQITISNELLSKLFLHIFIVMGTLKWLWNCLAWGFKGATKELIPTSQDSNRANSLHNFSKHLVLWVVFFFLDKFFGFLEIDN